MTIQEVKQKAARIEVWTNRTGVSLDKFFGTVWTEDLKFKSWEVISREAAKPEDRYFTFIIDTNHGDRYFIDLPTLKFTEEHGQVKVVFVADRDNKIIYAATEKQAIGELGSLYYELHGNKPLMEYYECTFIIKENPVLVNDTLLQLPIGQNKLCFYVASLADIEKRISKNSYTELIVRPVLK